MGAVSRSGLKSIFIGNTAERVLDRLQCDLLVVKPRRFESRVPRAVRGVRIAAAAPLP
jgi:universal stress protein E